MEIQVLFRGAILVALFSLLSACSSGPKIIVNQDPAADFTQYRTYAYMQPLSTDRNGARSVLSSFLIDATNGQLQSRGLVAVDGNPDLLVDFIVSTRERVSSTSQPTTSVSMHRGRGGAGTWGGYSVGMSTQQVTQTTEGTLAIDLIDRARNQLVWEAAATGRVTDKVRENLEEVSNAAVADMFVKFPLPPGAIPVP